MIELTAKPELFGKFGAKKLTPEEQCRWFIEAVREAGASAVETDFNAALKRIVKPRTQAAG